MKYVLGTLNQCAVVLPSSTGLLTLPVLEILFISIGTNAARVEDHFLVYLNGWNTNAAVVGGIMFCNL